MSEPSKPNPEPLAPIIGSQQEYSQAIGGGTPPPPPAPTHGHSAAQHDHAWHGKHKHDHGQHAHHPAGEGREKGLWGRPSLVAGVAVVLVVVAMILASWGSWF